MPKLHILSPSSIATTIELTEKLITVGRTGENTIRIEDTNISSRHGILVKDGDEYQLHDFKSTNGTFRQWRADHGGKIEGWGLDSPGLSRIAV